VIQHPSVSLISSLTPAKDASNPTDPLLPQNSSTYPNPGSLTAASTAGPPPPSGRRALLVPLAAAGGAALAALFWLAVRGSQVPAPAPQAAPPAPQTAAPAEIEISVAAKPTDARLFLDGALLEGNPLSRRFPRDGGAHTLRAEAPGYAADTRTLTFDKDLRLELALEREPAGTAARPAASAVRDQRPSPPPDDGAKRPGATPVRPLDTVNPFTSP
jgi:serine/threonine-protein kinase